MPSNDMGMNDMGGISSYKITPGNRYENVGYKPINGTYDEPSSVNMQINHLNVPKGLQSK